MSTDFEIFTGKQITSLRKGGKILRDCLAHCRSLVKPGITTKEIDAAAEAFIRSQGGLPAFKGYSGFPATLCTSVNDEVVHGIPGPRILVEGDIISLDGGVIFDGLYTDACISVGVGRIDPKVQAFMDTTEQTLEDVVRTMVKAGIPVGTISSFIQRSLESHGYSVIKELTGHGLGTHLHQFPDVPNFGIEGKGPVLPAYTLIAIEPIAGMGGSRISTDEDHWTIRTRDGSLACHFEHTVLITPEGCEVMA